MSRLHSRARRAFTLVEVLIALAVLGIIGAALVRMIVVQSRFTEKQMARRNSRTVSRNSMNILLTDLRMLQDAGGLVAAGREAPDATTRIAPDSIVVRVPVAFGLVCSTSSGTTLALMPIDSAMYALGYYGGVAVRDSVTSLYSYRDANPPQSFTAVNAGVATECSGSGRGISALTFGGRTGKIVNVNEAPGGAAQPGWPAFLYQQITYKFDTSATFRGRVGLYRKVRLANGNVAASFKIDELIAPFDTTAGFRYFVGASETADPTPPADLNTVRGIQLNLAGSSPGVPVGEKAAQATLVTGVFFKNRRDP